MLLPKRPLQHATERRRGEVERSLSVQDEVAKLSYFLKFAGAGEGTVDVNFPCRFIDVPTCADSFHLDSGVLEDTNFPWASCGAIFKTEERAGKTYYIGATLIVVMGGTVNQRMTVHWSAEGKAIVGPITD